MKTYYTCMESPVGRLVLTSDGTSLTALQPDSSKYPVVIGDHWIEDGHATPFPEARRQLDEYFAGRLVDFELPLAPNGTPFQRRVWQELRTISPGTTTTYGDIARRVGSPNGMRAVGLANGKNPIAIIVPCHRVIGANGTLTGYAGGLDMKKTLLDLETSGAGLFATR
jgi:methylated-DNA-[protein]-cysteine S-methyltransferase